MSQSRYGLGTCYLRMSKLRLAEYHFRKAVEIHPNNAVLLGCVGMVREILLFPLWSLNFCQVVERRGDRDGARALFDKAVQLSPENALVRYRRAKILISAKEYKVSDRVNQISCYISSFLYIGCDQRFRALAQFLTRGVKCRVSTSKGVPLGRR